MSSKYYDLVVVSMNGKISMKKIFFLKIICQRLIIKTYLEYGFEYKVLTQKAFYRKFMGIVSPAITSTNNE